CMAALLAGLHRRDLLGGARRDALRAMDAATLAELADEAVLAAAITCTRPGADPPTAADLREAAARQGRDRPFSRRAR
ncbi:MAG TPA: carbohydrate kinase, partial [Actinomycetota bacterium]|nr:carbohydrate kinase [Actinomycetota bacterium]